jgi:hypothetical protein
MAASLLLLRCNSWFDATFLLLLLEVRALHAGPHWVFDMLLLFILYRQQRYPFHIGCHTSHLGG